MLSGKHTMKFQVPKYKRQINSKYKYRNPKQIQNKKYEKTISKPSLIILSKSEYKAKPSWFNLPACCKDAMMAGLFLGSLFPE